MPVITGGDLAETVSNGARLFDLGIDHDVGCENVVVGGEAPDMNIVNRVHARHIFHMPAQAMDVDVLRNPFKQGRGSLSSAGAMNSPG